MCQEGSRTGEPKPERGVCKARSAIRRGEIAVNAYANWQATIWKILCDPTTMVAATILVMLVATWVVVEPGGLHPAAFPLFGRG